MRLLNEATPGAPGLKTYGAVEGAAGAHLESLRFPLWGAEAGGDPAPPDRLHVEHWRSALQRTGGPTAETIVSANTAPIADTRARDAAFQAVAAATRAPFGGHPLRLAAPTGGKWDRLTARSFAALRDRNLKPRGLGAQESMPVHLPLSLLEDPAGKYFHL